MFILSISVYTVKRRMMGNIDQEVIKRVLSSNIALQNILLAGNKVIFTPLGRMLSSDEKNAIEWRKPLLKIGDYQYLICIIMPIWTID